MENLFLLSDEETFECFKKTNPTPEDYYNIVGELDPEFSGKCNLTQRSSWEDEKDINVQYVSDYEDYENEIDRYNIKLPYGYKEIELYDSQKTFDENFEKGSDRKYVLVTINKNKGVFIPGNYLTVIPTPQSKCLIDIEKVEEFGNLEFIPIDYDTFFGLRLLSFQKYKSDFFLCDERVMFEAFMIKYQRFGFKPFYWSKEVIFEEVGIKKDRATKIIEKFIKLGIATRKLVKTQINNRPMQINYYDLNVDRIVELIPEIYLERDSICLEREIKEYLTPKLKKK